MLNHYLVIDTATDYLFVSRIKDNQSVFEHLEKGNKDHAIKLMPSIEKAMNQTSFKDLDGIVVGIGPGSYTGVRMGVVAAKVLAKETGIPLYKISSLLLKVSGYEGTIASVIDAKRDHVFVGIYDLSQGTHLLSDTYKEITWVKTQIDQESIIYDFKPDILMLNKNNLFEIVNDIERLTPNYLRKTQAENERTNS